MSRVKVFQRRELSKVAGIKEGFVFMVSVLTRFDLLLEFIKGFRAAM